jgi:hypothetical protein
MYRVLFDTVNTKNRDFEYEETGQFKDDDVIEEETRIDSNDKGNPELLAAAIRKPKKYDLAFSSVLFFSLLLVLYFSISFPHLLTLYYFYFSSLFYKK